MKKIFLAVLALSLILFGSVNVSLAYLTDMDSAYNSFTVGQVGLSLSDEVASAARAAADNKLIPGCTYEKKPVITVDTASEDCWLFVKLENGVESIEPEGEASIAAQMEKNNWKRLDGAENIWYHDGMVSGGTQIYLFESFSVDSAVTAEALFACDGAKIAVTAYGIQAAGFDSADDAWAQAKIG